MIIMFFTIKNYKPKLPAGERLLYEISLLINDFYQCIYSIKMIFFILL